MPVNQIVNVGVGPSVEPTHELEWAAREAHVRGGRLNLVHAYGAPERVEPWLSSPGAPSRFSPEQRAERFLVAAAITARRHWPDLEIMTTKVVGRPVEVLLDEAEKAYLTVLGTEQYGGVDAVLGSVGNTLATQSPGPVVIVKQRAVHRFGPTQVVVGVDGTGSRDNALAFAFDYADHHARSLRTLYCWAPEDGSLDADLRPADLGPAERWLAMAVAGFAELHPSVPVRQSVLRAHPVVGLVGAAGDCDLVVVGRHIDGAGRSISGAVTQAVLQRARCTVAVVPSRSA